MHVRLVACLVLAIGCTTATPATRIPMPSPTTPAATPPPPSLTATATLRDIAGTRVGTASFTDSYSGVIVVANVTGIGLGAHAVHIHEVGKCVSPFTTAGDHFNPEERHHGFRNGAGPHLGDLPNIDMPAAGVLKFEFLLPGLTLKGRNAILDADGASIVIHSNRDDYMTDPAGGSGARLACGAIGVR
jgi:superoxide dismutase, Cu-Zn family